MWCLTENWKGNICQAQTTHGVCPPKVRFSHTGILSPTTDSGPCSILMHMFLGLSESNKTDVFGREHSLLFSFKSLSSYMKDLINYLFTNNSGK